MFLQGEKLKKEIRAILKEPNLMCAVAYWGAGSQGWLEPDTTALKMIVCDALSGGTNPKVLRAIMKRPDVEVRHCDALHAKVYIGTNSCVVTSSNASTNGVGVEGDQAKGLIEAGYLTEASLEIKSWFKEIWFDNARPITEEDLERAAKAWEQRRRLRPKASFSKFDPDAADRPLIYWYWTDAEFVVGKKAVLANTGKADLNVPRGTQEADGYFSDYIVSETSGDTSVLELQPLLLMIPITNRNRVSDSPRSASWFRPGRLLKSYGSYKDENEARDAFLSADDPGNEPFDLREKHVWPAILKTLRNKEFEDFLGLDYESPDYNGTEYLSPKRIERHRDFWKACKAEYLEMAGTTKI